jgi:hypothetical protein
VTRDEILNMPAGREMDALIAENLFGWHWVTGILAFGQPSLISPELYGKQKDHLIDTTLRRDNGTFPHYSTDIAAAWEVVEKMRDPSDDEPDFWVITDAGKNHGWVVSSYWAHHDGNIDNFHVQAETAPLAICRASLLAVMQE